MRRRHFFLFAILALLGGFIGESLTTLVTPTQKVIDVLETPDLKRFAVIRGSGDSFRVQVMEAATGRKVGRQIQVSVGYLSLSGDGEVLFYSKGKEVRVYKVSTGKVLAEYQLDRGDYAGPIRPSYNGRQFYFISSSGGPSEWVVVDSRSGKILLQRGAEDTDCFSLVFSSDGKRLAAAYGQTDRTELWTLTPQPRLIQELQDTAFVSRANRGKWFATRGYATTHTFFYDFNSGAKIASLPTGEYDSYDMTCDEGRRVLTSGHDGVKVWSLDTSNVLYAAKPSIGELSADGTVVCSSTQWKTSLHAVDSGRQLLEFQNDEGRCVVGLDHKRRKGRVWIHDFMDDTLKSYTYKRD